MSGPVGVDMEMAIAIQLQQSAQELLDRGTNIPREEFEGFLIKAAKDLNKAFEEAIGQGVRAELMRSV